MHSEVTNEDRLMLYLGAVYLLFAVIVLAVVWAGEDDDDF